MSGLPSYTGNMRPRLTAGLLFVALMVGDWRAQGAPSWKIRFSDLYTLADGSAAYCVDDNSGDLLRISNSIERFPTPLTSFPFIIATRPTAFYRRTASREWLIADGYPILTRSLANKGEWVATTELGKLSSPTFVFSGTDYVLIMKGTTTILIRDHDLATRSWYSYDAPLCEEGRVCFKTAYGSWKTFDVSKLEFQNPDEPELFSGDITYPSEINEHWVVAYHNRVVSVFDRKAKVWQEMTGLTRDIGLTQDAIWGGSQDGSVVSWTASGDVQKHPLPATWQVMRVLPLYSGAIVVAWMGSSTRGYGVFLAQHEHGTIRLTKIGELPHKEGQPKIYAVLSNELIAVGWDGSLTRFKIPSSRK